MDLLIVMPIVITICLFLGSKLCETRITLYWSLDTSDGMNSKVAMREFMLSFYAAFVIPCSFVVRDLLLSVE